MFVKVPLFYIRLKNNLVSKRVRIVLAGEMAKDYIHCIRCL